MSPRGLVCRAVRTTLVACVLDTDEVPPRLSGHVDACLRCQAVVAQARRLRRALRTLGPDEPARDAPRQGKGLVAAGVASVAAAAVVVARVRSQRR